MSETQEAVRKRGGGHTGKRRYRRWPQAPVPVRALWESASEEEKRAAHEAVAAILEWWLGRSTRAEVAARLGVGAIRAWQLSQQALAGMAAGLLAQPKARKAALERPAEQDARALRKEVAALEKERDGLLRLVECLRGLPGSRTAAAPREPSKSPSPKMSATTNASRGATADRGAPAASVPPR